MKFPKRLVVDVTEEDIELGEGNDCEKCPISLALLRMYPSSRVVVHKSYIYIEIFDIDVEQTWAEYHPSSRAVRFMGRVDTGVTVQGSRFILKRTRVCTRQYIA